MISLSDTRKIGIWLTGLGLLFFALGVMMMLDKGLLAMGNFLFLAGITMVIGPSRTLAFFFQKKKIRGSVCFFLGVVLVLLKWTILGIIVEVFGFFNLFGDFFPTAFLFARNVPMLSSILRLPGISHVLEFISPRSVRPPV